MRKRTTFVLGAFIGIALVTLAACGGDDPATPTPTTAAQGTVGPVGTFDPNALPTSRPTRTANVTPGAGPQPCSLLNPTSVQDAIGLITNNVPRTGECEYTGATGTLI